MLSLLLRWCLLPVQYYEDEQNKAHRCYTVLTILLQCDVVHHCYAGLAILKCHDLYTVNHCSAVLAMLLECGELDTVHCLNVMSLIQFTVWMLWSWYSSLFQCDELDTAHCLNTVNLMQFPVWMWWAWCIHHCYYVLAIHLDWSCDQHAGRKWCDCVQELWLRTAKCNQNLKVWLVVSWLFVHSDHSYFKIFVLLSAMWEKAICCLIAFFSLIWNIKVWKCTLWKAGIKKKTVHCKISSLQSW